MILDEILAQTREDVEKRKKEFSFDELGRSLAYNPYMPRDVKKALARTDENPYRIIAEVKKASPSKGIIREDFDPVRIAKEYELGKADAISILTEEHRFLGSIEYVTQIRRYVPMPLLRKDFIVDEYQLLEALVYGADFVLLIAKALSSKELKSLYEYALHLGLDALVEVHDVEDVKKALFAGVSIIGINHRNLNDFQMDMTLASKLIPLIPNGKIIVAESGIDSPELIQSLSKEGVDAFLIGEHFMRREQIADEVLRMKGMEA